MLEIIQELVSYFNPKFTKGAEPMSGFALLTPRMAVKLCTKTVVRREVAPGRLLTVEMQETGLAEPLPVGFTVDPEELGRLCAARAVQGSARGFFWSSTLKAPARCNPATQAAFFTNFIGPGHGGMHLSPGEFFAEIVARLEDGTFTVSEVETFIRDVRVAAALRAGAIEHVSSWLSQMAAQDEANTLSAIAKARLVPGFEGGDREALLEYADVLARKATIAALFALVAKIKAKGGAS